MTRLLIRDIVVTLLVPVLVFLLPAIDRAVCAKAGLNIHKGLSRSKHALALKYLRYALLTLILLIYILVTAWLVFFSRTAASDVRINSSIAAETIRIDTGEAARQTFRTLSHVYLNIMMFVPLGYLLPYVFDFFRRNSILRSTVMGMLLSLFIENVQLITLLGRYELDDLIANTLGAFLGSLMYKCFAYVLTHPGWRTAGKHRRHVRQLKADTVLAPLYRHTRVSRVILYASDAAAIESFYADRLGFELTSVPGGGMLLQLGPARIEVVLTGDSSRLLDQRVILYAGDIDVVRHRLTAAGIPVTAECEDPFEHKACITVSAPDSALLTFIA